MQNNFNKKFCKVKKVKWNELKTQCLLIFECLGTKEIYTKLIHENSIALNTMLIALGANSLIEIKEERILEIALGEDTTTGEVIVRFLNLTTQDEINPTPIFNQKKQISETKENHKITEQICFPQNKWDELSDEKKKIIIDLINVI